MNEKTKYNYLELGWVDQLGTKHDEGEIMLHPSGNNYIRKDGNWTLLKEEARQQGGRIYIRRDGNWRLYELPGKEGK